MDLDADILKDILAEVLRKAETPLPNRAPDCSGDIPDQRVPRGIVTAPAPMDQLGLLIQREGGSRSNPRLIVSTTVAGQRLGPPPPRISSTSTRMNT